MIRWMKGTALMASLLLGSLAVSASAGPVIIANPFGSFQIEAKSLEEMRWDHVVKQEYDFSCGSAAVATLLTHHYDRPTTEAEVFEFMIDHGDVEKIETYGFSMLDMKRYLDSQGLDADGFRIALEDFIQIGLPAITLINTGGYKHFVVIKGMDDGHILVGDPAVGTIVVPREKFQELWTGTVLGARQDVQLASRYFNHKRDWKVRPEAPIGRGIRRADIGSSLLTLPGPNEIGR